MRGITFSVFVACLLGACEPDKAPPAGELPSEDCADTSDGVWCRNDVAIECRGGQVEREQDCRASEQLCAPQRGCLTCMPGARSCQGQQTLICAADGSRYEPGELCTGSSSCSERGCRDLCAEARAERSYIGCEYFPVFTSNDQLDESFRPAVVIANPNLVPARISISGGEQSWPAVEVAPQGAQTVLLDYVEALQRPAGSALVRGGAYQLISSVPVTVHQFNPLLFEVDQDCVALEDDSPLRRQNDDKCNSFSNDASLLLPAHVLTRPQDAPISYLALARATFMVGRQAEGPFELSPGFVAVVAVGQAPVHVSVTSSAFTRASAQPGAGEPLPALVPGQRLGELTMMPGDVLQLLSAQPERCNLPTVAANGIFSCPLGAEYDLTGTRIEADGPIEVIGGHNCTYVPLDRQACDHLEETMMPVDTWGVEAIASRPRGGVPQPHLVRVLSAADDNLVRFVPELLAPLRLARGAQIEVETTEHVMVRGEKPIAVAQFLVGQGQGRVGDPSQSLAIPSEQYRSRYVFLSPATYDVNYVSIIAQIGDRVILDGREVEDFDPIQGSSYQVASVQLRAAGAHEVHSEFGSGIGVQLYGFGDFTSYMLPGGLDLRVLGPVF